ncbi:PREDICTED: uncharacterized protein LOC104803071 [Tarenaya hassleriana]|uniref:uncharacterized protein LOC104803071 n=1 Tax=Tarenaya hassleriana TaxID=28532 RepID=UPI00053C606D|nr:PREDICTED: uncharacterized protein LOC104803071 [Tarenaya hassleriana]
MNNSVVDVSPFLLFEATADSETDCHIPDTRDDDDDNDDAESCRAGSCETPFATTSRVSGSGFDSATVEEEEGEEVNSYGKWARRENQKLVVDLSASKGKERASEMERSRLFWEACLTS